MNSHPKPLVTEQPPKTKHAMSIRNSTLDIPTPQEKQMKPPTPTTSNESENCYTEPILPRIVTGVNLG